MKIERADANVYRVVEGDTVKALAMKLVDGKWGAFDTSGDKALTKRRFNRPAEVRDWLAGAI